MALNRITFAAGVALTAVAIAVAWSAFAKIGTQAGNAILLTDYLVAITPGQELTFGYSGESMVDRADVLFQGREMNDVAFSLSLDGESGVVVKPMGGVFDEITVEHSRLWLFAARRTYHVGDSGSVAFGERFLVKSVLGRASFHVFREQPVGIRLSLDNPVVRELGSGQIRMTLGQDYVGALPVDASEVVFRTRGASQTLRAWQEACGLRLEPEHDWAVATGAHTASQCLSAGTPWDVGALRLVYRRPGRPVENVPGSFNRIQLYGLKLALAIVALGFAFLVGPQIRLQSGPLLFGCAVLLIVLSLALQARDYFLEPFLPRFLGSIAICYWSAALVFATRIPVDSDYFDRTFWLRLLTALSAFVVAAMTMFDPFDGSRYGIPGVRAVLRIGVLTTILWLVVDVGMGLAEGIRNWWDQSRTDQRSVVIGALAAIVFPLLIVGLMMASGGDEAINFQRFRVYIPAVLAPLLALTTSLLLWRLEIETDKGVRNVVGILLLVATVAPISLYRLWSGDNGGTAILSVAALAAAWLNCRTTVKQLTILTVAAALMLAAVAGATMSQRFDLAWAADQQRALHYDAARNLRTARDLARAGGWLGRGPALEVPAVLRANIHNDLVMAYTMGYFGWILSAVAVGCLALLYALLLRAEHIWDATIETTYGSDDMRRPIIRWSVAVVVAFAVQSAWVAAASLQSAVPMTGQDLPPLSASALSLVGFIGVLFGCVSAAHNLTR